MTDLDKITGTQERFLNKWHRMASVYGMTIFGSFQPVGHTLLPIPTEEGFTFTRPYGMMEVS